MPDTTRVSAETANGEADDFAARLAGGFLRLYDSTGGEGQPASVDDPVGSQVLLAELRFADPAAPPASDGLLIFSPIESDTDAAATGLATWFRTFSADGTTPVWDGSVGDSGSDATIRMNAPGIQAHSRVDITGLTFQVSKG